MQEIHAWLNNGTFNEGVILYHKYGNNTFLKQLFKTGPSEYNKRKLREEMEVLAGDASGNSDNSGLISKMLTEVSGNTQLDSNNSENFSEKPSPKAYEYYLKLCKNRDQVNRQIERNMSLLDLSKSKNIRHDAAKNILQLAQKKTEIWANIDYYNEHGCFEEPSAKKIPVKTDEIQRLYVQINKAEKRLKSDKIKYPEKTLRLLQAKKTRLEELKAERAKR